MAAAGLPLEPRAGNHADDEGRTAAPGDIVVIARDESVGARTRASNPGTSAGGACRASGIGARARRDGITPPTRTARNRRSSIS
ncbi:hypothetical protein ACVHYJ_18300 [Burkholderia pyrrocinia]